MNKPLSVIATLACLLAGCGKPAETAAPGASPVPATAAAAPTEAGMPSPATPAPPADGTQADGGQAVDARIDALLGDHARYRAVILAYQAAVAAGDREAVASLVRYPLQATVEGNRVRVDDAASFVRDYERILTPDIVRVVAAQRYADLMVNQQGIMFGSGETWINGICSPGSADCSSFEVKVVAIQPGGRQ